MRVLGQQSEFLFSSVTSHHDVTSCGSALGPAALVDRLTSPPVACFLPCAVAKEVTRTRDAS